MKSSSQSLSVSTQISPPSEPVCSSELPVPGLGLQHSASSQTRNPDCVEDTGGGAVTNLDATGATGGQPAEYKH